MAPRPSGWSGGRSRRKGELPSNWAALRRKVIERDVVCQICGSWGNHVDHIDRFGPHELWNLRLLCEPHHMERTGRDGGLSSARSRKERYRNKPHPGLRKPK